MGYFWSKRLYECADWLHVKMFTCLVQKVTLGELSNSSLIPDRYDVRDRTLLGVLLMQYGS